MGCNSSDLNQFSSPQPKDPNLTEGENSHFSFTNRPEQMAKYIFQKNRFENRDNLSEQQLQEIYTKSGQNVDNYFRLLEQKISSHYLNLARTTLENMNTKKFIMNESKVYISEAILSANLSILKVIGNHNNHNYDASNFKKLNKIQKNLIGYLKSKYPRSAQSFVPGDLMNAFKEFSMVQHPKNDILKNANVYFGESDHLSISKNVKIFINKIIDQLDTNFPIFQKLLQQKVFVMKDQKGQNKSMNYKIGRKIPQNIAKYTDLNKQAFQIRDPQIFRVIIKWVSDMEDFLLNPQQQTQEKQTFKIVIKDQDQIEFDDVNVVEIQIAKNQLITKLQEQKQSFQKEIHSLINQMDHFNSNLLKILGQGDRVQKFVPKKQAQVIKYAMFNTKLLSWMVAQKLMIALEKLINVGKSFEHSSHMIIFDFIKFNVTDLMRAMVTGSKKQIFQAYQNLKKLEQNGDIRIIKVKNRLATPLNDAMIIFTMKNSFIICELQLILTDKNQGVNEKLKNIETLNHFFYQLQRSPYGVQSQLAIVLGFKDSKIKYQEKISYQQSKIQFEQCNKNHPQLIANIEKQLKPFICSRCTKFYESLENMFTVKNCTKCNSYLCSNCFFKDNPQYEQNVLKKELKKTFRQEIERNLSGNKKLTKQNLNGIYNLIIESIEFNTLTKISQIAQKKSGSIKIHKLTNYIKQNLIKQNSNQRFFYMRFKPGIKSLLYLKLKQDSTTIGIQVPLRANFNIGLDKQTTFKQHDFIILMSFKNNFQNQIKIDAFKGQILISPFNKNFKKEEYSDISFFELGKIGIVVDGNQMRKKNHELQNIQQYQMISKKIFQYQSIEMVRQKLPDVKSSKQIYDLANTGIDDLLLKYFERVLWKTSIKEVNLAKNQLTSIQTVVQNLVNIETLFVSENFLFSIIFVRPLQHLRVLNASYNRIQKIQKLNNLCSIQRLQLHQNRLENFEKVSLKCLKQLNLSSNQIKNRNVLQQCQFPAILQIKSEYGFVDIEQEIQKISYNFPKLKNFINCNINSKIVEFTSNQIERLNLFSGKLQKLELRSSLKLQFLNLNTNRLFDIQFLSKEESLDQLLQLDLSSNNINKLSVLRAQKLKKLDLSSNPIENISIFQEWYIPNLQHCSLNSTTFQKLVNIPSKKLTYLSATYSSINDITCFQNADYPQLLELLFAGCSSLKQFNLKAFQKLQSLNLSSSGLQSISIDSKINLQHLESIDLSYCASLNKFSPMSLKNLKTLNMSGTKIEDFDFIGNSNFPQLELLSLYYLIYQVTYDQSTGLQIVNEQMKKKRQLPVLNFENLKKLELQGSSIFNVKNLQKSNLPNIEQLTISYNKIKQMPPLNFKKLKQLNIDNCQLTNLEFIKQSNLLELTSLYASNNKILQISALNLPKLQTLYLDYNQELTLSQDFSNSNLPQIKQLHFYNNKIKKFTKLALPNLQKLEMTNSPINSFQQLSKCSFSKINQIYLYNINQGEDLPPPIFTPFSFKALSSLTISSCKLKNISFLKQCNLPLLKVLNLSTNQIQKIQSFNFPKLSSFQVSYNKICQINEITSWNCQIFQELNFQNNQIKKIPKLKFKQINYLYFSYNQIQDVSEFINSEIQSISMLQFSNNSKLKNLPFISFCSVANLYLNQCSIQDFSQIQKFERVEYLYLNSNKLKFIPEIKAKGLKDISATSCEIQNISEFCKGNYSQLSSINFSSNKIKKLSCLNCPQLLTLYLNNNEIQNIDELKQSNISKLTTLYLQYNKIKRIPALKVPQLQQLNVSNNQIESLDQVFSQNLEKIMYLTASNNKIKKFKAKIYSETIYSIDLNNNQIQRLKDLSFLDGHVKNLFALNLSGNKIQTLDKIQDLGQLNILYLQKNPLTNVDQFLKSKSKKTITITMSLDLIKDKKKVQQIAKQLEEKIGYCSFYNQEGEYVNVHQEQNIQKQNQQQQVNLEEGGQHQNVEKKQQKQQPN